MKRSSALITFKKLWHSLNYTAQLAALTTVLVLVTIPLTVLNNARSTATSAQAIIKSVPPSGLPTVSSCIVTGCSGELCVDSQAGDIASSCDYKPEYVCYTKTVCSRQEDGQCGWTQTAELIACLRDTNTSATPVVSIQAQQLETEPITETCAIVCPDNSAPLPGCNCPPPVATPIPITGTPNQGTPPSGASPTTAPNSPPNLLTDTLKTATVDKQYRDLIIIQDTDTNDTLSLDMPSLPPNLIVGNCVQTKTQAGVRLTCPLAGKPEQTGVYRLTVNLKDSFGNTVTTQIALQVDESKSWFQRLFNL